MKKKITVTISNELNVANLQVVKGITKANYTQIVEQALSVYFNFLKESAKRGLEKLKRS